jgi:ribosomal protein S18 acetylase RimI-like enzyme
MAEVYATSDGMSETFGERYPNPGALAGDLAAIDRLPGGLFVVAESGGLPCGYLSIKPRQASRLRHTADLQMGVGSAQRRRGLGRRLVANALDRLAACGIIEIVYLMVRADNDAAIRLYASAGFDRLATLQRDTRIGENYFDGVLMRRFVGAPVPGTGA